MSGHFDTKMLSYVSWKIFIVLERLGCESPLTEDVCSIGISCIICPGSTGICENTKREISNVNV